MSRSREYVQTKVNAEDLRNLAAGLEQFKETVRKKIVIDAMMAGGKICLTAAQGLVSRGRTGQLRRSLELAKLGKKGESVGGARVLARRSKETPGGYYAHLVERGHRIFLITRGKKKVYIGFWPGRPFMRPALENNRPEIIKEINKVAAEGAEAAAAKIAKKAGKK